MSSNHLELRRTIKKRELIHHKSGSQNIPHAYYDNKTLLVLLDPTYRGNYVMFQRMWRKQQPVVVIDVSKNFDINVWNPNYFSQNFGEKKFDFINCVTGETIFGLPMSLFWNGFENRSLRPRDEEGRPMVLKLKDWPPCANFQTILPIHWNNIIEGLPLPAYTHPRGLLNLFDYIPAGYLSQDLGTELVCAYGTTDYPSIGSTNLNKNLSDNMHLLVYVGNPGREVNENDNDMEYDEILQIIEEAGCDRKSVDRVRNQGCIPGAIWHVFNIRDSAKINEVLCEVSREKGLEPPPNLDPIQGGTWYLDDVLRHRLKAERVKCNSILQCVGDAILIPGGAPHQVKNLRNCIIVKHDFISSINVKKL